MKLKNWFFATIFPLFAAVSVTDAVDRSHWYIRPFPDTPCPAAAGKCYTFTQILQNTTLAELVFSSNTDIEFLSGDHVLNFENGAFLSIAMVDNLTLIGSDEVITERFNRRPASRVMCKNPFGMGFINMSRLSVINITFSGCGVNSSELNHEAFEVQTRGIHGMGPEQKVALLLINIRTFQLLRCVVENSLGYGMLGINLLEDSEIVSTVFVGNNNYTTMRERCMRTPSKLPDDITSCSGGNALIVFEDLLECPPNKLQYSLSIRNSVFLFGVSGFGGRLSDIFLTRGTGLGIVLAQSSYGVNVVIDMVLSYGNSATVGANLYVAVYDRVDNSTVRILNSNSQYANGGLDYVNNIFEEVQSVSSGLHYDYGLPVPNFFPDPVCAANREKHLEDVLVIRNTNFTRNIGILGSGSFFELRVGSQEVTRFKIENCTFLENTGTSGTAMYISQQDNFDRRSTAHVILKNIRIISNGYISPIRNLTELYTNFRLSAIELITVGNVTITDCVFTGNEASALSALGSKIFLNGVTMFEGNSGVIGGGMDLESSHLSFMPNSSVTFSNNYALYHGGAINIVERSDVALPCFFQIYDPGLSSDPNVVLFFEDNYAEEAGSLLYGGSVNRCITIANSALADNTSGAIFDYLVHVGPHSNDTSLISSDPVAVCICPGENGPDCTPRSITVATFPGATIQHPFVTVGQRSGTSPSVIYAIPDKKTNLAQFQDVQRIEKTCTMLNFTINTRAVSNESSSSPSATNVVIRTGNLAVNGSFRIDIEVLRCPPGFVLNEAGTCVCDPLTQVQDYDLICNIDNQTVHREGGSWINASFFRGELNGVIYISNCPYDYCLPVPMEVNLLEPDTQCAFNRTGVLCGACEPGLSVSLSTSECLSCSNSYLAMFIVFISAGIFLVVVLFLLNLTITTGTLSGIIFYANIVHFNQSLFFPTGTPNVITVFVSWLSLDSGLSTCLYDGLDGYVKIWFKFFFPLYIWVIVIAIIFASRFSTTLARICGSKSVPVLATLLLLSYNQILQTTFISLSPTYIVKPYGYLLAWSWDGNVGFLSGKHLILGIFAILFLVFFIIPYTLLLVVVPLSRVQACTTHRLLSWINKLKPFMDAHFGPYKNSYRNWTGILLLIRILVSILIAFNVGNHHRSNVLLFLSILMFLLVGFGWVSKGGMYKKWPLNVLECSFFLNLGVLSVSTLYVMQLEGGRQDVVGLLSGYIALAEFIGVVAFHTYKQLSSLKLLKKVKQTLQSKIEKTSKEDLVASYRRASGDVSVSFVSFREPLIED